MQLCGGIRCARALLAGLCSLAAAGCVETAADEPCRPTNACPAAACGPFFDGCTEIECRCSTGLTCDAGACVGASSLLCGERRCGELERPEGGTVSCGTCAPEASCSAAGACDGCGEGPLCDAGHPCAEAQLCSAVPGCLRARPLAGGAGDVPPSGTVEGRPVALEHAGAQSWLWHAAGEAGSTWSLRRVPLVDGVLEFAGGLPVEGLSAEREQLELPPTTRRGEELWALVTADPPADPAAPASLPRFVRFSTDARDGSLQELGEQPVLDATGHVPPQFVDGLEGIALIGHHDTLARWARRVVAADGSVSLVLDPALDTVVPGLDLNEGVRYVQLACDDTRLLAWVSVPGVQGRRLIEVELTVEGDAPRLGAAAELTVISDSGEETAFATAPGCGTFFQARDHVGLTEWRAGACE